MKNCDHPDWKFVADLTENEKGELEMPPEGFIKVCIKCGEPIKKETT